MFPYPETARQRIAELHDQAQRDTVAIALRRARTDRSGPAMPARLARAARHMLPPGGMRAWRRPVSSTR